MRCDVHKLQSHLESKFLILIDHYLLFRVDFFICDNELRVIDRVCIQTLYDSFLPAVPELHRCDVNDALKPLICSVLIVHFVSHCQLESCFQMAVEHFVHLLLHIVIELRKF